MPVSQSDIDKYLRGELSHAQRHAIEKAALRDPFLADALAGAQQLAPEEFGEDVALLQRQIRSKAGMKARLVVRMAAGVALILGAATLVYFLGSPRYDHPPLALQHDEGPAPERTDEVGIVTDSLSPHPSEPMATGNSGVETGKTTTSAPPAEPLAQASAPPGVGDEQVLPVAADAKAEGAAEPQSAVPSELPSRKKAVARDAEVDQIMPPAGKQAVGTAPLRTQPAGGQVVSAEDGTPLPGINIMLKGTSVGTITDADGRFELPAAREGILVFSFVGLQSIEVPVASGPMAVRMPADVSSLSEVVVTGRGLSGSETGEAGTSRVAEPRGGRRSFNRYLEEHLIYPEAARVKGVTGKAIIQFRVQTNGALSDFVIIKGIGSGCEEELIHLIKNGPAWSAEQINGKPVVATVRVRFNFRLSQN